MDPSSDRQPAETFFDVILRPMQVIDRRRFIRVAAVAVAGAARAVVPLRGQAQDAAATSFRTVRRGVGIFTGPGGTIGWLTTPDGILVIDSQFPATAGTCLTGLRQRSRSSIEVLINTHHHADHTAGNSVFRSVAKQIVQHEQCAALHRGTAKGAATDAEQGFADTTFADSWSIGIGDERISAAYYGPAHTRGDVVIVFENADVVHMGDLVFNRVPPFVDRTAGASIRNWIGVLDDVVKEYPGATFIFGHGRNGTVLGTAGDVTHFRNYLTAVVEHVQKGIAARRSQAEIASLQSLPGFADVVDVVKTYASPFPLFSLEQVLTAAYQELRSP
jgi:glyoxylase-like metal-dependent hydrolase (beta-lactamase superfamily II)